MKIKLVFLFFILFYLAIIIRLFMLQVINSPENKSPYLKTNKLTPIRGRIYDKFNHPLVLNQNSYLLYLEPKKIIDKDKLINSFNIERKAVNVLVPPVVADIKILFLL